jgi:hypothetical protein
VCVKILQSPYRVIQSNASQLNFFLIGIVGGGGGGGVQLGQHGNAATNRPILPAPVDYDDGEINGMIIGKGN